MVESKCTWCEVVFLARKDRVEKGQSRFCSLPHYREWVSAQGSQRKNIGKENALIVWDKSKGMYCAYWYDENSKYHSTTWARWAWELNFGEVPNKYTVSLKDGNPRNNVVANLFLQSPEELGKKVSKKIKGIPKSKETRRRLSVAHRGKILSETHRINIGNAQRKKWADGLFDRIHKGKYNSHWRGGVKKGYPKQFDDINPFIRERDRYMCQICGKRVHKNRDGHVHHISGNREDNSLENLILVCVTCHGKIHAQNPAPPPILAFRSRLEWNKP